MGERSIRLGDVSIAGAEAIAWRRVREPADTLEVSASPLLRHSLATELGVPGCADLACANLGPDPVAWAISTRLRSAVRGLIEVPSLEADTLVRHLYRRIFETRFGGRAREKGDGALDARRLGRVIELIEARPTEDLRVAVLANVAALSPYHFLRSFKRATGMAPHQFVRARRLERAREYLQDGWEVGEAARATGLLHLRHLRAVYYGQHGCVPEETGGGRREACGV